MQPCVPLTVMGFVCFSSFGSLMQLKPHNEMLGGVLLGRPATDRALGSRVECD
jgi:hypothetical protein